MLEDRVVPSATVQFSAASETVNASTGTFSIPVTLSAAVTPSFGTFAAGLDDPFGMAFDAAGNLYVNNWDAGSVSKVTPAGVISTFASGFNEPNVGLAFDAAGNLYVANFGGGTVDEVTPQGVVSTFASGFDQPLGLAFDSAGNLYVAQQGNGTIDKVTPAVVVSTFASGLSAPTGLAFGAAGNLYVADGGDNTVSKVTPAGVVSTFASGFNGPSALAFDAAGNLYVVNYSSQSTVSMVTPAGQVSTFSSAFNGPQGVAVDAAGNLYVSNYSGSTVEKVTTSVSVPFALGGTAVSGTDYSGVTAIPLVIPDGQTSGTITGTLHSDPGANQTLTFTLGTPIGVSLGSPSVNTLTITEPGATPTVQFSTASETVNESAGTFSITVALSSISAQSVSVPFTQGGSAVSGTDYSGLTASPLTIAAGQTSGTITGTLLADPGASKTLTFTLGSPTNATLGGTTVNTLSITEPAAGPTVQFSAGSETVNVAAGTFSIQVTVTGGNSGGGTPTVSTFASGFSQPAGLAFDAAGNLYVADQYTDSVDKVTPAGVVTTFATGFSDPDGLAFDSAGNLYVANFSGGTVSEVTPAGVVSTFASGFNNAAGLAFDADGNLYVANSGLISVSKVTPGGVVSTFVNGIIGPEALAFDLETGDLYVSVHENLDVVSPAGVVISSYYTGLEDTALAFDSAGDLYSSDGYDNSVSETTPAGGVTTVASGLNFPYGLALDTAGNLYVSNSGGTTVDEVTGLGSSSTTVTVPFTLGGTAVAGTDYSGVTASPLTIPAGQTSGTITGTLRSDPGASPTLTFNLGTPTGANLGSPSVNTMTITEPAATPTVQFSTASETVNESVGTFSITVALSATSSQSVSVPFTLGGTAVSGTDYRGVTASPLTIPAGQTSGTITGTLLPDPGTNKTLTLTLDSPTNATLGGTTVNTLTVTEPAALTVQFSTDTETVDETARTFISLASFTGADGADPYGGMVYDSGTGNFFGTTHSGGASGEGTVFHFVPSTGTITTLFSFSGANGMYPSDGLVEDSSGNLYGTTLQGGASADGTVFKFAPRSGTFTLLGSFNGTNGASPISGYMVLDSSGNLFGATGGGGASGDGTVFEVAHGTHTITTLASFNTTTGANPVDDLVEDSSGNLFGATLEGGASGVGTVFELAHGSRTITPLASFNPTVGSNPYALIMDKSGNLFGTTHFGGSANVGTVYEVAHGSHTITKLASFNGTNGSYSETNLVEDGSGNIFGTAVDGGASGDGVVFEVANGSNTITPLLSFDGRNGSKPYAGLVMDSNGNLYGVTTGGGVSSDGTIFELSTQPPGTFNITVTLSATSSQAVSVPFTTNPSSTAVQGIDYTGITASPLVIPAGQTTATVTGTLIPDPGASKTLLLTLGTPTGGATLGNSTTNTLTIDEPQMQTLTWTGKGVGPQWDSSQWVNNARLTNWVDGNNNPAVPIAGGIYAFVFPAGKLKNTTTNIDDVPNLTATSIEVGGTYTFNGAAPLTLDGNIVADAGAGTIMFKMGINLAQDNFADITDAKGANVVCGGPVSGAGGIQKDGPGTLTFVAANNAYQDGTTLNAGTLDLEGVNQLGTGPINGPAANSTVVIDPLSALPVTLTNPLNLNGGTLDVLSGRSVNIAGPVKLNSNSEIDLASGAAVVLDGAVADGGGGYTLTVGKSSGQGGTLTLQGSLTTTVNIAAGQAILVNTFTGTGNLIVNGGTLKSNANNAFSGSINVQTGSIIIGASPIHSATLVNPFGTGQLTFGNAAVAATFALVSQFSGSVTLGNSVVFNGGTLSVTGNLAFSGPTTLMNPVSFVSVSAASTLALQGGVSSASGKQDILAETGAGVLEIGGTLQSAIVFLRAKSNFKAIAGLSVVSSLVLDANGDVLED